MDKLDHVADRKSVRVQNSFGAAVIAGREQFKRTDASGLMSRLRCRVRIVRCYRRMLNSRLLFLLFPGSGLGPARSVHPGSIFSDMAGVWPVVSGERLLASGMVDAGGRSGVTLCGCASGFELSAGGLSPLGACVWPSAAPEATRSATVAKITG